MVFREELSKINEKLLALHMQLERLYVGVHSELAQVTESELELNDRIEDFNYTSEIRDAQDRIMKLSSYLSGSELEGREIRALEETKLFLDTEIDHMIEGLGNYRKWDAKHWKSDVTDRIDKQIHDNLGPLRAYTKDMKSHIKQALADIREDNQDVEKFMEEVEVVEELKKSIAAEEEAKKEEKQRQEDEKHAYHNVMATLIILAFAFAFLSPLGTPSETTGQSVLPISGLAGLTFGSMAMISLMSVVMLGVLLKLFDRI